MSAPLLAAGQSAATILQSVRQVSGGTAWNTNAAIIGTGKKQSFGLEGTFTSVELVGSGRFMRMGDYGILRNAEGLDGSGRWRMDNSGGIHPLDSDEASQVARTEAYLAGREYLFAQQFPATLSLVQPVKQGGQSFDRIVAIPAGGRAAELWIGRDDHLVHRAVIELSTVTETIDYRDYRRVGLLLLPFRIQTNNGDQSETGSAEISAYRVAGANEALVARPRERIADARILSPNVRAIVPLSIDAASNFPIVWASVNGAGPQPFILDTGGHDILTPTEAESLGLTVVGSGFSLGAGSGSAPTKFTRVERLLLGRAEIADTPFTVLDVDLGTTKDPSGKPVPVAGLLGLELFERFRVTLEAAGHMVLEDSRDAPAHSGTSIPIRFTRDMPLIDARVAGHSAVLAFDTGNNVGLIIAAPWAKSTGLSAPSTIGQAEHGASVGGDLSMKLIANLRVSIGGLNLGAYPAMVAAENMGSLSSRSEAGNIGLKPLERFDVVIDYARGMMTLRPAE
jgi:hypothetical protein